MKIILLIVILFFACGIAMVMVMRLADAMRRLGDLQGDMKKSNEKLRSQLNELQAEKERRERLESHDENDLKT